ncbi:MAG: hypothetical protein AAFS07_03715 [Pseudomonadota bacterium]
MDSYGLILNEDTQKIISVDPVSAYIFCCLEERMLFSEIIDSLKTDLSFDHNEAVLRAEGFLNVCHEHYLFDDDEAAPPRPSRPSVDSINLGHNPGYEALSDPIFARVLDTLFRIEIPRNDVRRQLEELLESRRAEAASADVQITVSQLEDALVLSVNGVESERFEDIDEAIPFIKSTLSTTAINRYDFDACFHAAVVATGTAAILLPGQSGAGKSCLTVALTHAGFKCITDETAILNFRNLEIWGVPLPCCVKKSGWDYTERRFPEIATATTYKRVDGKDVRYIAIADQDAASRGWGTELIVFPNFNHAGDVGIRQMHRTEALELTLKNCIALRSELTPAVLDHLIVWIKRADAFRISYGPDDDPVAMVKKLIDQRRIVTKNEQTTI